MSRGRQKVSFEGLLQENVLGTFKIIRGFADLRDLAEVSVAMPYQGSKNGQGSGYQRQLDEQHVVDIKSFLSKGRYRFFPEIVLSLRSKGSADPIVTYTKRRASPADKAYRVSVNLKALRADGSSRIHRIDGNHRLEAAKRLFDEQRRSASFKDFSKAPFCFVVLDSDKPEDDELAEAMLFNLINSKALPIASEHSLSVLMRDDGAAAERFVEDPQVYLTRWIRDKVKDWPQGFYTAMGDTPLSRLHSAAGVLLRPGGISKATQQDMSPNRGTSLAPCTSWQSDSVTNTRSSCTLPRFSLSPPKSMPATRKLAPPKARTRRRNASAVPSDGSATSPAGSSASVPQTCPCQPTPPSSGPSSSAISTSKRARSSSPCPSLTSRP